MAHELISSSSSATHSQLRQHRCGRRAALGPIERNLAHDDQHNRGHSRRGEQKPEPREIKVGTNQSAGQEFVIRKEQEFAQLRLRFSNVERERENESTLLGSDVR